MSDDNNGKPVISGSVPVSALAAAGLMVLAAVTAYLLVNREDSELGDTVREKTRGGGKLGRRLGLRAAIMLIENDATRRVVLAVLKAMLRRA
ncbi:MAG: hypothetical protein JOZ41_19550 [Chloroflexi bacterium]|jgi:hypothetical protein|nr:hypothetical protein [Chloroflexota bacterium]